MNPGDSQHADKIELPIAERDITRVLESASVIHNLFKVDVSASGSQTDRRRWVTLRGRQENIAKAKKYVQAMCNPEVRVSVEACRDPTFTRLLHMRWQSELERDYQTVLTVEANGSVLVLGSEVDVYAAVDRLHSLMSSLQNSRTQPPIYPVSTEQQVMTPHSAILLSRGSNRRESRIKYFVELGYSRDKVESVLYSLPDAPDDDILARLVQCTPVRRVSCVGEWRGPGTVDPPPMRPVNPELLRHIVIDGSNVAMRHGNGQVFSCKGIQLAVDYFKRRGHTKITVFVPEWRKEASTPDSPISDQHLLHLLEQDGHLKYTPSRRLDGGRRIVCYDDRYIVKLATDEQGVIVSNDQFRDLVKEKAEWKEQIETRLLQFAFANDYFMPPDDPLGRNGPTLDQLLSKDPYVNSQPSRASRKVLTQPGSLQICPHLERCTFGPKCKYYHPERDQSNKSSSSGSTGSHTPSTSRSPTPSPSPDKRYTLNTTRSREDLRSSNHDNISSEIPLGDLSDRLSNMSIHNKPDPPQYINLQQPRLDTYSPQVMRSTPSLPTPQEYSMLAPPDSFHGDGRPVHHTFPMMNLSHAPPSFVDRPRGNTDTHQLLHTTHHTVTPSHPHRSHTHEHEYFHERQHAPTHQQLTGFPGPHPNYQTGLLPRDSDSRYHGDPYRSASPRHFMRPPTTHSHSYPTIQLTSHESLPSRPRTLSDGYRGYSATVFEQALAVLGHGCEDRLRRVFARYPGISNYEEAVELARTIDMR